MKKSILAICLILGTVIGSGFSTGKEIAVFFSRFGYSSFLFVPLAFVLFYFIFYFLMAKGSKNLEGRMNNKHISILMLACSSVFSASMFAGVQECCSSVPIVFIIILMASIFILSFLACFKKLEFLSKVNLFLIPILLIIILIFFIVKICSSSFTPLSSQNIFISIFGGGFYCLLYVILNVSLSSVVIADAGKELTKKQIKWVSFISAFILSAFIFIINLLIICNYELVSSQMPLLELSSGIFSFLLRLVIMLGCLTTLLSTIFIASSSCKSLKLSDLMTVLLCVIMPYVISVIGFAGIVSWLYPFVSFVGILLLFMLFFQKFAKFIKLS